ncbi:FAD dependent oxidoreductase [Gyrodon lividus]|nr:FAD dependent oxidoreductase [Gyrodon lividus]
MASPSQAPLAPATSPPPPTLSKTSKILIIGAGTFGLSTALHLLKRGYRDVTVLDRAAEVPAVDAASTDINKVVRSCYGDIFYTRLAREAMVEWKKPEWEGCYHECGVFNVGGDGYDEKSRENDKEVGAPVEVLPDAQSIRTKFLQFFHPPESTATDLLGPFTNYSGYFNAQGGWAEAARAVRVTLERVRAKGGKVLENKEVIGLVKGETGKTTGVRCNNGERYNADRVVLAVGSWTASTFPGLEVDSKCLATGQSLAMIQLDAAETERYKRCPVYLDFDTGFYTFPPTGAGIVKLAIHAAGHTHMVIPSVFRPKPVPFDMSSQFTNKSLPRKISTPRTVTSHPASGDGLRVPRSALEALREQLRRVYPELAEKPWAGTRMCWYTDSPDEDWVIGPYPGDPTLFLATSGSGHGFKFLPNIGRLVSDSLEGTLDAATAARFAIDRNVTGAGKSERVSQVTRELDLEELCGPEDMLSVGSICI